MSQPQAKLARYHNIFSLKKYIFYGPLFVFFLLTTNKMLIGQSTGSDPAMAKAFREFESGMSCHFGISVYDVQKGQWVFRKNEKDYFIPASNTKILTLYTALHTLKPQLDAAYTLIKGDTLFVWGMADPGTLYPNKDSATALINLIRKSDKTIIFSNHLFQTARFGKGWAWDDHPHAYQCERNEFPIYGNRLWIDRSGDSISVTPAYFTSILKVTRDTTSKVDRSEWGDQYSYNYIPAVSKEIKTIPITFFRNDLNFIWGEATGKHISSGDIPFDSLAVPVPGSTRDTLLKLMMRESDNFIAEELMLAAAFRVNGVMNEGPLIDSMLRGPMSFLLDTMQWMDGSGLSRYNLTTPNIMIRVLNKIYEEQGLDFIKNIFAEAGQNGSIKKWFSEKDNLPVVYAKTGSMRNVFNLSGYLITRKGKVFIFSWMNNQCMDKPSDIRKGMEKFLSFLYEEY